MPASLKPAEAMAWCRLARGSFYRWLATSGLACHLGGSIRIPTRRFMIAIGVLDDEA
jgi:ABC-type tungstate transport system substrate-binding protein